MQSVLLRSLLLSSGAVIVCGINAVPAHAAKPVSPPPACDRFLTSPDAVACTGYYEGNLFGGDADKIAAQQAGVASLTGDFTFDGNWDALDSEFKIEALSNINQLNFGTKLFGETIVGAHFGNVAGPAQNVSVFWLFDFGNAGADYIRLDDTQGFSNAVLYRTGSPGGVPEPRTWAMMLFGFGAVGFSMRRRRTLVQRLRVVCA